MNPRADHLSPAAQYPGELGHRGQRAGDGVRQHGRDLARPASPSRAIPRPATSELYGEFLVNAQGEDVVAGIRTPQNITEAGAHRRRLRQAVDGRGDAGGLRPSCRAIADARERTTATCRTSSSPSSAASCGCCRRAAASAPQRPRCASPSTWSKEGLITRDEAVTPDRACCARSAAPPDASIRAPSATCSRRACPPRPGAASGEIVFSADEAETLRSRGQQGHSGARRDQSRGHPWHACGGRNSDHARRHDCHAAVVARGMGKPCVSGAGASRVDYAPADA